MTEIEISGSGVDLDDVRRVRSGAVRLRWSPGVREAVEASRRGIEGLLAGGRAIYGVNTGFGRLANVRVEEGDLARLQVNLVRSHAAGVGEPLSPEVVRSILLLKTVSLARGASGVRWEVVERLGLLLERDVLPVIPTQGSVGASGDLAPLAHLALVLIGEGEALVGGERLPGAEALAGLGLEPLELQAKEGLALLNGTQVSTALALHALFGTEQLFRAGLVTGALSVDALQGSDAPFDARIQELRPHAGQVTVARALRRLMAHSDIRASHVDCERVQDPYSLRCQPQVMGAVLDLLGNVRRTLAVEAGAVSDNPVVVDGPSGPEVLSGGNFHAQPVAFAADILALALCEMGSIAERRVAVLVDPAMSGLPAFLTARAGLESGYMIAQVTAAALVAENRQLAHPGSVDSVPTSANQEDHVSMATHSAARLGRMLDNARRILAVEALAAAEGIDRRRPLRSSEALEEAHRRLRERVPVRTGDRVFSGDIEAVAELLAAGGLDDLADEALRTGDAASAEGAP